MIGNSTNEIDDIWKTVPNTISAMKMIRDSFINKTKTPYAYIDLRETLQFARTDFGERYFYLPSESSFSQMYSNILAIPLRKDFSFYNEFNQM